MARLRKLLDNDRTTSKLIPTNPFPAAPPASVRASRYHYRFSTRGERRATGAWWVRTRTEDLILPRREAPA